MIDGQASPGSAAAAMTNSCQPPRDTARDAGSAPKEPEPVLCRHCGRTANNGISCQGFCVADSGY